MPPDIRVGHGFGYPQIDKQCERCSGECRHAENPVEPVEQGQPRAGCVLPVREDRVSRVSDAAQAGLQESDLRASSAWRAKD